jgi:3-deoxy-manno-octulosonate cytidylyltransferase (CMP-KDO synthetase)
MSRPHPDNTLIVIPSRMGATRLPGKALADIAGEPMIVQVWRRARASQAGQVLVAAAEAEIAAAVRAAGGDAVLTDPDLLSGTDRVAQAVGLRDPQRRFEFIVNLQGDLPTLDAAAIGICLAPLEDETVDIATLASEILDAEEARNPNVVKAIADLGFDHPVAMASDFRREIDDDAGPALWPALAPHRHLRLQAGSTRALRAAAPERAGKVPPPRTNARPRRRHDHRGCPR